MSTLKKTIKHHVKIMMIKKTVFLIFLAAAVAFLSYIASEKAIVTGSENYRSLYTLGSVVFSFLVFFFVAIKIRYFHWLFGRDWTGTVIETKTVDTSAGSSVYAMRRVGGIRSINLFVITVQIDGKRRKKKLSFPLSKISHDVYSVGDKIYMIRGTYFPINLTKEEEQHICPMCARNSCYGDYCPDCNLKY